MTRVTASFVSAMTIAVVRTCLLCLRPATAGGLPAVLGGGQAGVHIGRPQEPRASRRPGVRHEFRRRVIHRGFGCSGVRLERDRRAAGRRAIPVACSEVRLECGRTRVRGEFQLCRRCSTARARRVSIPIELVWSGSWCPPQHNNEIVRKSSL